jgi:serine/threonine protein kinase
LKPGDSVNGYLLTTPFTTTGGGHCQWAFATKHGNAYFIKQFLTPTYPDDGAPGSAQTKAKKRERCERFERHHLSVKNKLAPLSARGGNLVVATDFFRYGAHYYKVTTKVEVGPAGTVDVERLPLAEKIALLLNATHSLDILHSNGLVHGDIKPPNILIERASTRIATKLIDFDNCFVSGDPPAPDELVGDLVYHSPEMIEYLLGTGSAQRLAVKSDLFALGLTFTQYLTGQLPGFSSPHRYPAEALLAGKALRLPKVPGPHGATLAELLTRLLARHADDRPTAKELHEHLQRIRRAVRNGGTVEVPDPPTASGGSTLRGTLLRQLADRDETIRRSDPSPPVPGGLRGSLLRRITDRLRRITDRHGSTEG